MKIENKTLNTFLLLAFILCIACKEKVIKEGNKLALNSDSNSKIQVVEEKKDVPLSEEVAVIYRSEDKGKSWSSFANGVPKEATLSGILQKGNRLYVTTDYHGVYYSENGKNNWIEINNGLPKTIDINCIEARKDKLVIGTLHQGIYVSNDKGLSWAQSEGNIKDVGVRAFVFAEDKLLAGTDAGVYESDDMGNSWEHKHGTMQILGFTILDNKIYAAAFNGALMSKDNGQNWQYIYEGDALHDIGNDGQYIYAMTISQKLLKSRNDGSSWEVAQNGIQYPANFYTNELKQKNGDTYSAQWIGIYHSVDNGNNWKMLKDLPESTAFSTLEITDFGVIAGISIR